MKNKTIRTLLAIAMVASFGLSAAACASQAGTGTSGAVETTANAQIQVTQEMNNSTGGEHVITADGQTAEYSSVSVTKTGDSSKNDEADFYGDNSAVFATNGATLTLSNMVITTNGTHANAVFSYGKGTTVNVSNSAIETTGNCSGGIMTTGGGTMNATDLTIHTTGNSSAAIRSDRGGGTVTVTGGTYTTDGTGSPAIYSTADITVNNATLTSTASEGVVVEGKNSVTLNNVTLKADHNVLNSKNSTNYNGVMIYQSMSGDADEGTASFTMKDGSFINANGDVFFVNNTVATITLENVSISNKDANGVFLRAAAAGWGTEGSNGGQVNLYLNNQNVYGDIVVDKVSGLNMYMASGSVFEGAVNKDNAGQVFVQIEKGSTWTLTGDSYVTSLTCDAGSIKLNGYKLYVNGKEYAEGTASEGEAIVFKTESSASRPGGNGNGTNDGQPPEMPNGEKPSGDPPSGNPPGDPPSGDRPELPTDANGGGNGNGNSNSSGDSSGSGNAA